MVNFSIKPKIDFLLKIDKFLIKNIKHENKKKLNFIISFLKKIL